MMMMNVLIDSGISSVHTTPNSFALIQIVNVCMIVRNLSFLTSELEIDFVYLSANSHAVTKSTHFTPKTDNNCSCTLSAFLNGTLLMMYGKLTLSGR